MVTNVEANEKVIATAQKIVNSLGTSKNIREDMILILSKFDNRLLKMSEILTNEKQFEERFEAAKKVICEWEGKLGGGGGGGSWRRQVWLWEDSLDGAAEYLSAVDVVLELMEYEDFMADKETGDRVDCVVQMVMLRLEDEFRHLLVRNVIPLDGERLSGSIRRISLSGCSNDGASEDCESSVDGESRDSFCEEGRGSLGEDFCIELMNSEAVIDLKEIAERMVRAGYEKECCNVYCSVRRDVLFDYLSVLGVDKVSIEEVQRMEWGVLNEKMRRWVHVVKVVIRGILYGEKQLCDRVFGGSERIRGVCFVETTKRCVMQLLNFGEAVVIGQRSSEKLFRMLDMYEALADVRLDLQELFPNGSGDVVCSEALGILAGLGDAAKCIFAEFENAVQGEASRKPTQGGEVHPMARYVMNYIKLLVDYNDSLNFLLESGKGGSWCQVDGASGQLGSSSPMGCKFLSLISSLESNLEEKSKHYEDGAMRYIFLMNNLLYIVQKVKGSEVGKLLGDLWVRKRRSQIKQYATGYLRASWTKVLATLKDEGARGSGSLSTVSKTGIKDRFKNFNAAFEDIYKHQTAWKVPDPQLREELRISISEKVLPAYGSFMGRFRNHLENERHAAKYIKYTPDDLENLLVNLFEGTPQVLHSQRRRFST